LRVVLRHAWRTIIIVVGTTLILIGLAMLVLPGPGIVVIIAGLAILAREFIWAQGLLDKAQNTAKRQYERVAQRKSKHTE
jgi:tellurite resistance protein TerC